MDAIIQQDATMVKIELIHRRGADDTVLYTNTTSYNTTTNPEGEEYTAQMFDFTADNVPECEYAPGDQFVLRYTLVSACTVGKECYFPNADGNLYNGRIPHIDLPR